MLDNIISTHLVLFVLCSCFFRLRKDIKIFHLNGCCRVQLLTGNTLLALKKANLTSNAKPRKRLIAVTKRLLRCVSGVKKKMRKDVFCY